MLGDNRPAALSYFSFFFTFINKLLSLHIDYSFQVRWYVCITSAIVYSSQSFMSDLLNEHINLTPRTHARTSSFTTFLRKSFWLTDQQFEYPHHVQQVLSNSLFSIIHCVNFILFVLAGAALTSCSLILCFPLSTVWILSFSYWPAPWLWNLWFSLALSFYLTPRTHEFIYYILKEIFLTNWSTVWIPASCSTSSL